MIVQPREVFDHVYRATRLTGADDGIATIVARSAKVAPDLDRRLCFILDNVERGVAPEVDLVNMRAQPGRSGPDEVVAGMTVSVAIWDRLVAAAKPFLVSEQAIDDVE